MTAHVGGMDGQGDPLAKRHIQSDLPGDRSSALVGSDRLTLAGPGKLRRLGDAGGSAREKQEGQGLVPEVDGTASGWTAADLAPSAGRVCSHLASGGFGESCRGQVR